MNRGFRFTEYRYFFEVANQKSIRKAADVLHVSPSALSRQIKKIEQIIGFEVVERNSEGVKLTVAGEELLDHVRQSFANEETLFSRLDDITGMRRGHVSVACGDGFLPDLLGETLVRFASLHPNISFDIRVFGSDSIVKAIVEEEVDFGLVFYPPTDRRLCTLAREKHPLHAIVAPSHPLAGASSVSLRQLCDHPLALPTNSHGIRQVISSVAYELSIEVSPRFSCNSIMSMKAFAEKYGAGTVLPTFAAMPEIETGRLCAIPVAEHRFRNTKVELIARRDRRLSRVANELIAELIAGMSALNPGRKLGAPRGISTS